MATSPFANPLLEAMNVADTLEPFAPWTPPPVAGLGLTNIAPSSLANSAALGERFVRTNQFDMPQVARAPAQELPSWARAESNIFYSPTTKEFSVGGFKFGADDEAAALEATKYLGRRSAAPSGDWIALSNEQFGQLVQGIKDPSAGRLFSRNFGRGVDTAQMLVGRGLQLAGAEQLGGRIVEQQMEDLRKTSPYERMFTDIGSSAERGLSDWLIANFAQAGPSIVESLVVGAIGYLGGTAASGNPLGGAAASLASIIGKESWKNSVKAALTKASSGQALSTAERKLIEKAAGIGGAVGAQFASGMATGAADVYGEFREQGAGADDNFARLASIAASPVYAALDVAPDALLVGRLLGRGARPELSTLTGARAKAGEILKRGAAGGAIGGLAEGIAEGGQEALILGTTGQDLTSPEAINRLINSFAAGAGVGGPIGAGTNILNPVNVLQPGAATQPSGSTQVITPTPPTLPVNAPVGTQGQLFPIGTVAGTPPFRYAGTQYPSAAAGTIATPLDPERQQQLVRERRQLENLRDDLVQQLMSTVITNERRAQLGNQLGQVRTALDTVNTELSRYGGAPAFDVTPQPGQLSLFAPEPNRAGPMLAARQQVANVQAGLIPPSMGVQEMLDLRFPEGTVLQNQRMQPGEMVEVGTATLPAFLPGEQGLLNIFQENERVAGTEIQQRMQPPAPTAPQEVVPQAIFNPLQGALQFAAPLPEPPLNTGLQPLQRMVDYERALVQKREQDFAAAERQKQEQEQAAFVQSQQESLPQPTQPQPTQPQQLELFTRQQAPRPSRGEALRRGAPGAQIQEPIAETQVVEQTTVLTADKLDATGLPKTSKYYKALLGKDTADPAQQQEIAKVFAQVRQNKTLPKSVRAAVERLAMQSFNQLATQQTLDFTTAPVTEPPKPKEKKRALRKRSAETVSPREGTEAGSTVGQGVPGEGQAPGTSKPKEKLKKGKGKKQTVSPLKQTAADKAAADKAAADEAARQNRVLEQVRKGELVQAGNLWPQYADTDTQPKWDELTDAQKEAWRKTAIEDRKPSIAAAEEIAPPKKKEPTLRVTQYNDGTFGLDWLDRGGRPAVERTYKTEAEARAAALQQFGPNEPVQDEVYVYSKPKKSTEVEAATAKKPQEAVDEAAVAWENAKPDGAPAFDKLPPYIRTEWRGMVIDGTASLEAADKLVEDLVAPTKGAVAGDAIDVAIATADDLISDPSSDEFKDALRTLVQMAFFDTNENNVRNGRREKAAAYISGVTDPNAMFVLRTVVTEVINNHKQEEARFTRGKDRDKPTPVFEFALKHNLLPSIRTTWINLDTKVIPELLAKGQLRLINLPVSVGKQFKSPTTKAATSTVQQQEQRPEAVLASFMDRMLTGVLSYASTTAKAKVRAKDKAEELSALLARLYSDLNDAGKNYIFRGNKLKDYFNDDGTPKLAVIAGKVVPVTEVLTKEKQREINKEVKQQVQVAQEEEVISLKDAYKLSNWNTDAGYDIDDVGTYFRDDGTPITSTIPLGRVQLLVKAFVAKLRNKPNVSVYKNVADLKAKNPALYRRAAAAREAGDFDTVRAVGYSFGIPDTKPQMSRRDFLRFAGAGLAALKLPPLSKEMQLDALKAVFEGSLKVSDVWFTAAKVAAGKNDRVVGILQDAQSGFSDNLALDSFVQSKELRSFLYNIAYNENYANDGYDYYLSELLSGKDGVGYVADLQQALQAQRRALLEQINQKASTKENIPLGAHVIIFSDFVRTEQQLRFVLAHETLGHFGFRAVMPEAQLNKILDNIYDTYPEVQAAVDAMVEMQGMDKREATEEFLADNAADLDVSILKQLWNALKTFLNKLGFKFQDDEARYLINLARKYVRRGEGSNAFTWNGLNGDLLTMQQEERNGRFARDMNGQLATSAYAAGALNRRQGYNNGLTGVYAAFKDKAFGSAKDLPGKVDALLRNIQSLDWMARRSDGLSQLYRMFEAQQNYSRKLLSKYQMMMEKTFGAKLFGYGDGIAEEDKVVTGELLARAALLRSETATDKLISSFQPLVKKAADGSVYIDDAVRADIEKAGFVTAEEFRKGFDVTYSNGAKVRFQYDVDENSDIWKSYLEVRNTINEAAIDMLLSNYEAARAETDRVVSNLNNKRRGANVFTAVDLATIRDVARRYVAMRYKNATVDNASLTPSKASLKEAEEMLISFGRALFNDKIYAIWMKDPGVDKNTDMFREHEKFQATEYDDIRAALPDLVKKVKNDTESFAVQKAIRDVFLFDLQSTNADYYAKRTILGSYVPFVRRGEWQARLVAVDKQGNPVELDEALKGTLPYFQTMDESESDAIAKELDKEFGGKDWTFVDDKGNTTTLRFIPEVSAVRQTPDLTEAVNYNEFVYALNRLNVNLTPETRERIVTTLTSQNARARKNLMRSGNEGWDKDVIRGASEHLETSAHVAAKKLYSHRIDDILLNDANWLGDEEKLRGLEAAIDAAPNDAARARAQRAYDEYALQYKYMAPKRAGSKVKIAGKEVETLGRGRQYQEEAKQLIRFYSDTANLAHSTEDMLSGEVGSQLKLWTVLAQLGGTVAAAVVNFMSTVTHSLPYLAGYNSNTAFGGGYGWAKSSTQLYRAATDLKNSRFGTAAEIQKMLDDGSYRNFGLTEDEARFLLEQLERGALQAAQFNALLGTARGKIFDNRAQAAIRTWMSMFTYVEQFNRRIAALAAYRMEMDRGRAAGLDNDELIASAVEAARKAVNTTQGEYALYNRPKMARGNVMQYLFMYKMFSVITIQLLRGMPNKERALMLGILILASGLKGLPFAEDLMDLIDTLMQRVFRLKSASIEKELAVWIDSVAPGMTPFAMRGVLDSLTGATISSRMSMGNLLPLTGALRYGANPIQELTDFAGPIAGMIEGTIGMAANLGKYGAEAIGLREDTTSFTTIMRESPVAAFRAVADGLSFMADGRITNIKGQVVSSDVSAGVIAARLLGFYPYEATVQNDIVRMSKYVSEYAKAIKAEYVSSYVKAALDKDTDAARNIVGYVKEWNEDAKGTGLEIRDFEASARRSLKEAERPTTMRYLRAAPKSVRPETEELMRVLGYDPE